MRKIIHYLLILSVIVLATILVVVLFYSRTIYQRWSSDESSGSKPLIVKILDRLSGSQAKEIKFVPKPEDTIRILEGWSSREIGAYLEDLGKWPSREFLGLVGFPPAYPNYKQQKGQHKDYSSKYSFLSDKPEEAGLEGYLFPDTYRIYSTSTAEEVIDKMLANFDRKLSSKMRADIEAQGKSIYSIVTMASIIEKEAPIDYQNNDARDAKIISGIFWNRLKIGQGLQSDATLSYILNDNKPQRSGQELEVNSLYNTYKYRGLPPGPIANPGLLAIEAAIYPSPTDYYYFLTPKGKSDVIYARTYEEHLRNKYKYLK